MTTIDVEQQMSGWRMIEKKKKGVIYVSNQYSKSKHLVDAQNYFISKPFVLPLINSFLSQFPLIKVFLGRIPLFRDYLLL